MGAVAKAAKRLPENSPLSLTVGLGASSRAANQYYRSNSRREARSKIVQLKELGAFEQIDGFLVVLVVDFESEKVLP